MWQKFDTEGIVHKEFVPPEQTVNGKFYYDVLRWLRENIWHKCPDKWCHNSWALHHDNSLVHMSLVRQFLASTRRQSFPTLPTHWTSPPVIFSYYRRWNWSSRDDVLTALKRSDQITRHDEDADAKWLPAVLLIMEIPLGSLYQSRRGLLQRGWRRIEITISG